MADLDTTLAAIDAVAVQECGGCGRPLVEDGPSPYYCSETCSRRWSARQANPLPDDDFDPQGRSLGDALEWRPRTPLDDRGVSPEINTVQDSIVVHAERCACAACTRFSDFFRDTDGGGE